MERFVIRQDCRSFGKSFFQTEEYVDKIRESGLKVIFIKHTMKGTEIRDEIAKIDSQLHKLSEAFARPIDYDGLDPVYLKSKFQAIVNTTNHIKGQIKDLK